MVLGAETPCVCLETHLHSWSSMTSCYNNYQTRTLKNNGNTYLKHELHTGCDVSAFCQLFHPKEVDIHMRLSLLSI